MKLRHLLALLFCSASVLAQDKTVPIQFGSAVEGASTMAVTVSEVASATTPSYTETFYLCATGDGSLPETATCATAWDAADFNTAGNWDTDDANDGKIGPNDRVIVLDDGGVYRTSTVLKPKTSGTSGKPITIIGESGGSPRILGSVAKNESGDWTEEAVAGGGTEIVSDNTTGTYTGDYAGVEDTNIKSAAATTNYGTDVLLIVGKFGAGDHTNGLIRFPGLSNIPSDATVTSVTLGLYVDSIAGAPNEHTLSFNRLIRDVVETQATWNVYSTGNSWTTAGALSDGNDRDADVSGTMAVTITSAWYTITQSSGVLLDDVQGFIDGTYSNYGWTIERTDGQNDSTSKKFKSSDSATNGFRPYLSVAYTTPGTGGNIWYTTAALDPGYMWRSDDSGVIWDVMTEVAAVEDLDADGEWWWDSGNSRIYVYDTDNPVTGGRQFEVTAVQYEVLTFDSVSYITLKDIEVNFGNDGAIGLNAVGNISHIIIDNIRARYSGSGILASSGFAAVTHDYITITNSELAYNPCDGVKQAGNGQYWQVSYNDVHHNATSICTSVDTGGIHFINNNANTISDSVVEHNEVYDNGLDHPTTGNRGHGIWPDTVGANFIVRYNSSYNNWMSGILVEISDGVEIYNNVIWNINRDDEGLGIAGINLGAHDGIGISGNHIYNNTIYNSDRGIRLFGNDDDCDNNIVRNNIAIGSTYRALVATRGCENAGVGSGNVYSHNAFGVESADFLNWGNNNYSTYDTWLAASSQSDTNAEGDPLFVSTSDFHLQSTSPAINAGTDVSLTKDFTQLQLSGNPDIGAYEYIAGQTRTFLLPGGKRYQFSHDYRTAAGAILANGGTTCCFELDP